MRRRALIGAAALALVGAGCGSDDDYANEPRPPTPINVTAAIGEDRISISPEEFGAGPIVMIISNQTQQRQTVTLETEELGGSRPGIRESTRPIGPSATARLEANLRRGTYAVSTDGGLEPVTLEVGAPRESAQHDLLQP